MQTKVLLIEPSGEDASHVIEMLLSSHGRDFGVEHVDSVGHAKERLGARSYDVVLLGLGAAGAAWSDAVRTLVAAANQLPLLVLTETDDDDAGVVAVREGAQDYLVKGRINGDALGRVIRYSIERKQFQLHFDGLERQIAERVSMERQLRDSRHRIQAITESLLEGVLVIDNGGRITFSNPAADSLLGDEIGSGVAGRQINAVFGLRKNDKTLRFAESPFFKVLKTGHALRDDDALFQRRDGRSLRVAFACSPLVEEGRRNAVIISFRDIRNLRRAQQDALQASKLASVGQLAAGIAHEINTPIQYVGDNLRFLVDAFDALLRLVETCRGIIEANRPSADGEGRTVLRQAMVETDADYLFQEIPNAITQSLDGVGQVARIVLAMKEFSHPGEREKTPVDLNRSVENTLAVSRNEWKHVAEVQVDLDPDLPTVMCLPGEMNQVLLNMVVNAAQAISAGTPGEKGKISIATRWRGENVDIVVEDDGVGMSEEVKERIFDPFFTTKEIGKGTGQGLAICRDVVVSKHGGRISVDSEVGRGTTFTISLPVDGKADLTGHVP